VKLSAQFILQFKLISRSNLILHLSHTYCSVCRRNETLGHLHDRLSSWKIPRVPHGLISSFRPVRRSLNLWASSLSSSWCTDGRSYRRARAPGAEDGGHSVTSSANTGHYRTLYYQQTRKTPGNHNEENTEITEHYISKRGKHCASFSRDTLNKFTDRNKPTHRPNTRTFRTNYNVSVKLIIHLK